VAKREKRSPTRPSARQRVSANEPHGAESVTRELRVDGMDCASCAATIDSALREIADVRDVRVDVVGGKVRVTHTNGLERGELAEAIRRVGYTVRDEGADGQHVGAIAQTHAVQAFWQRRGRLVTAAASGVFLLVGLAAGWVGAPTWLNTALLAFSTISGGWFVLPRGLRAARRLSLDMNFLMSIAAAGAWAIGERAEAAATLFLFAVAELLESYSMDRARNAIKALMDLSPLEARVLRAGKEVRVPVADVAVGEIVVVRPGEKLPVDGLVTGGARA
jgi:Cd2+/Zn2+-exporting ATPase